MYLNISRNQAKKVLNALVDNNDLVIAFGKSRSNALFIEYIKEELSDQEFHRLLRKLLMMYKEWQYSDMDGLLCCFDKPHSL